MKTRLDCAYLSILAALGLELGCAVDVGGSGDTDSSATSDTASSTDDGAMVVPFECVDPEPIMQAGTETPSGFVMCENGFVHRVEPVECLEPVPNDGSDCISPVGNCDVDADCGPSPYGNCESGINGCECDYGCVIDEDCPSGQICACAGVAGPAADCIPAACVDDSACGDELCGLATYNVGCGNIYETACVGDDAACHVDADCQLAPCPDIEGEDVKFDCAVDPEGEFSCRPPAVCFSPCGRPFYVEGEARVAPTRGRADWCLAAGSLPASPAMPDDLRQRLAAYWTEVGQFEHASIASFARFGLQLMRLGAPASLLRATRAATGDEIEHAQLAFALASSYAGVAIGPGALEIAASLDATHDVHAIVAGLVREACIDETLAALEAAEAASWARDPRVAATLEQIAADELRHAQLGWRALRWILDGADDELRGFALAQLDAAVRELATGAIAEGVPVALREHGLLDDALRAELRRRSLDSVIVPCIAALRGESEPSSSSRRASSSSWSLG